MMSIFAGISGLMIGSFLNVCIYRLPRNESIVAPRSHCPHCNHQLAVWENIPVVSYLLLRGRCSKCKAPISPRYFVVEILTAIVFVLLVNRFGLTMNSLIYAIILCTAIVITFIDYDHQIIPNRLLLIGLIPGIYPLISNGFENSRLYLIGGIGLGVGFFAIAMLAQLVFKKESMGMGDVKYAALIGLILGWQDGLVATALAFFCASFLFLILMLSGKAAFGQKLPFGPFLSLGAFLALFWGQNIIDWYLSLVF